VIRPALALILVASLASCGKGEPSKAERDAAKRAKDQALLALPYPPRSASAPASIRSAYDSANDRTTMTLSLPGLRADPPVPGVAALTLSLTSSFAGRERAPDKPEGSADASLSAVCQSPGALAFSGPPGTLTADGADLPLREASGKNHYNSTPAPGGVEESVRFRVNTPDLVAAANAQQVALTIGRVRVPITGQALSDLREFAARMNPRP
jgi:hypothetical protein